MLGNENIEMITPSLYSQGDQMGTPLAGPWVTALLINQAPKQGAAPHQLIQCRLSQQVSLLVGLVDQHEFGTKM